MRHLWSWLARRARRQPTARSSPQLRPALELLEERTLLDGNPVIGAGTGLLGTYYADKTLTNAKVTRTDASVNFTWGSSLAPAAGMPTTQWSARWTGQVQAQFTELYTFSTYSDDGIRLTVNGQTLVNNWTDHSPRYDSGTIALTAGQKYDIQLDYYQNDYGAVAKLFWASASTAQQIIPTSQLYTSAAPPPPPPPPSAGGTGLTGAYYSGIDFNTLVTTRVDPTLDFQWGGAPAANLPADYFSVRWTGQVQAVYTEAYTFTTRSDDGIRLSVNGQKLIDNWTPHAPTDNSGTIQLVAGQKYDIQVEFFEATYSATMQLFWSSASTAKQIIPTSQLFATGGPAPPPPPPPPPPSAGSGLTGAYYNGIDFNTLATTRVDATVDFQWGGAPAANVPGDYFSVRWTGQVQAVYTEAYTFTTRSDDGVRLYVNGQKLIDNWTQHGPTDNSGTLQLVAGQKYDIQVDYFEAAYSATMQLFWSSASTAKQIIPTGQLFAATAPPPPPPPAPPPSAALAAGNVTTAGATYTFSVTYASTAGIQVGSLGTGDVRVTGPGGYSQLASLVSVNNSANGTPRTATYSIAAPGGAWDTADNGTYTITLLAGQVLDTAGTAATAQTLGTFQATLAADWFGQNLTDAALLSLARSRGSDGQLSRADLLALFDQAELDNVISTAELNDLRALAAAGAALGMPDDVRVLATKTVGTDLANSQYQGQTLAVLAAGSPATVLQQLVNKWFLGLDRPALTSTSVTYVYAAGTLFGAGGPSYSDAIQGGVGDCYFVAALAELAYRSPSALINAFIDNGDGTFTVRFFRNGVADYVTVDRYLPAQPNGTYQYANYGQQLNNPSNVLWVALLEKAYAQVAASGWTRGTQATNAYATLTSGWEGAVLYHLANKSATSNAVTTASQTAVINAVNAGKMIGLNSNDSTAAGIINDHVYVLLSYNSATQTFLTWNPWGYTQTLTWAQIAANFSHWSSA